MAEVDHLVRGAAHGADVDKLVAAGHRLLVHPGRGYVTIGRGSVSLLAARDEEAAAGLLRAALHAAGDDVIRVEWLTADQQWAVRECHRAGLSFHLDWGALLTDGDVGPLHALPAQRRLPVARYQFENDDLTMFARSSSVGWRGATFSSRCCLIAPSTMAGTSSSV